ncbi:prolactin-8A4-like [Acomys russatus]|uniref:prolactin-8A4-like n=1 Tax=Acomys russatus TaxID=60746 RepID=UPI0021E2E777|nr:prolactin-8A4-like [Acomys russatus]
MKLPLSQPHFSGTILLLLISNLLLWEKAASIPACQGERGGCMDPLSETFNNAIRRAETIRNLADKLYEKFTKKYVKLLINFVGAWNSPLFHLMTKLSAMQGVPETILSKVKEMEENNRELLDDLRWILTKAYPTAKMIERFPSWPHLSLLRSSGENNQFLAIFNLSICIHSDILQTINHLRKLRCLITMKDC